MPTVREHSFAVESRTLNVAVGLPNGPPLVLLHGVTRRWQDFRGLFPTLAANHCLHAIDLRGHGGSSRAAGAYRVVDYTPDVLAYLRRAIEQPAVLVGHSLGGMVAAAVAVEASDRIAALVLEDPTFAMTGERIGETAFPDLFRAFRPHAGSGRPVAEIAAALAVAPIAQPDGSVARLGDFRDPVSLRFSAACLRKLDPEVLDVPLAGRWLDGYDVAATLDRVACPTLFLQADFASGGALPDDYAADLAGRMSDAVRIKLAGVGHNIHGTRPEQMLGLMLPFLDSLD